MANYQLVFINITNGDRLLNDRKIPIGFKWNIDDDLYEVIATDKSFKQYVNKTCVDTTNYAESTISYLAVNCDDETKYEEGSCLVQDMFKLDDESKWLAYEYLTNIFSNMYQSFMHKEYDRDLLTKYDDILQDIYVKVQEKWPHRFVKESVITYVRKQLDTDIGLSEGNQEFCIGLLDKALETIES